MIVNCIAVDDEPAALSLIVSFINQTPFLNFCGQYTNAIDALKHIHSYPDLQLIFLDIRMANLNGVELARIIDQSDRKRDLKIIFTTAYDQYAVESYKVDALDYLLKPFNFVDFSKAAGKAYDYFLMLNYSHSSVVGKELSSEKVQPYIYVKVEHQLIKVDTKDILYIEGLKDYVKMFLKGVEKPLLTLTSLKKIQEKLPGDEFLRLHRSFIVATCAIKSATKTSVIIGDRTIMVSDQFKEVFSGFLNKRML